MKIRLVTTIVASIFLLSLVACGGDDGDDQPADAPSNVPAMITVSGVAQEISAGGTTPKQGVNVAAFSNTNESTPVAMATTDANGMYTLTIVTNGVALDGYVKATANGLVDTYLYAPGLIVADFTGATVNMVATGTFPLLTDTLCGGAQDAAKGTIAVLVQDGADVAVGGATITSTPTAGKYCYNMGGLPNRNAAMTDTDGIGYMINVTGEVTVAAAKAGSTFKSHKVTARAGALTTTLIEP